MNKKKAIILLVAVNVLLALAVTMGPVAAQIFPKSILRDCCQGSNCCVNCCWIVQDCDDSGDCLF